MLFDSSVRREIWRAFIGTLVVLLTVVMTTLLVRVLSQATKGIVGVADVSLLLGYTLITQLPPLISLALFVAVVTSLSRMQRDSEMVVWQSSGVRHMRLVKPVWEATWPVLLVLGLLVLAAKPWGQHQMDRLRDAFEQRSDLARVAPGQFQTSSDGRKVFFIDSRSDGERVGNNVFIVLTEPEGEAVITARQGTLSTENELRFLNLTQGERIELREGGDKVRAQFDRARLLVGDAPGPAQTELAVRAMGTLSLMRTEGEAARAELVSRLATLWSALNLPLIAVASARTQARRVTAWNVVWSLLVFVVYFNLLSLTQSWVMKQVVDWRVALIGLHGGITLAAFAVLAWRDGLGRQPTAVVKA